VEKFEQNGAVNSGYPAAEEYKVRTANSSSIPMEVVHIKSNENASTKSS
jgi:hypothetical protein